MRKGTLAGIGFGAGVRSTTSSAGSLPGALACYGEAATLFAAIIHYDTPGRRFARNGSNVFDNA